MIVVMVGGVRVDEIGGLAVDIWQLFAGVAALQAGLGDLGIRGRGKRLRNDIMMYVLFLLFCPFVLMVQQAIVNIRAFGRGCILSANLAGNFVRVCVACLRCIVWCCYCFLHTLAQSLLVTCVLVEGFCFRLTWHGFHHL